MAEQQTNNATEGQDGADAAAAAAGAAQATEGQDQAATDAAQQNGAAGAAQAGAEAASEAPARPEYIPEKFWDAETGAPRTEDLAKSYTELERARLERAKNAPSDYHLPSSFKGYESQMPEQTLAAFKDLAKTEGYSQRGFELLVEGTFGNPQAGRQALEAEFGEQTDETLQACATFANTLGDHPEAVQMLVSTPAGVKFLNSLREKSADPPLPGAAGEAAGAGQTEAELKSMMKDPRYSGQNKDPAFIEQVTQGWQKLYGGKTVQTAPLNRGE